MSKLPLSRFKVIDLTRVRAGPTCVRQLADWGAEVIKVESAEGDGGLGGARHGPDFQNLHRNKRSITLDLKKPQGLDVLYKLVKDADVAIVEATGPGDVFSHMSWEAAAELRKRHPKTRFMFNHLYNGTVDGAVADLQVIEV